MPVLTPVNAARVIGAGRIVIGLALLAAPSRAGAGWLGESAATPGTQAVLRGMGVRDTLIGIGQVHTAGDPQRGYRWARTSAIADAGDLVATLVARSGLPASGVRGAVALAGLAALGGLATSRALRAAG